MKYLLPVLLLTFCVSCASIKIDEKKGTYSYSRFGPQELHGIKINMEKSEAGSKLESSLNRQKSDPQIVESLAEIRKMVEEIMGRLP